MVTQTGKKGKSLSLYFPWTVEEWKKMTNELTHAQLKILGYIRAACGPWGEREIQICVKDLANELSLNRSTVSRALKHLSNENLIDMELVRVGVKLSAAAIKGYRECDRAIASCDPAIASCDPAIASCDPAIASTIYKYLQLFSYNQLTGKESFAEFQEVGSTDHGTAALLNQLENLFKQLHQNGDQFFVQATGGTGTGGSAEASGVSAHVQVTGGTGTGGTAEASGASAHAQATGGTGTGGSAKTSGVSAQAQATGGTGTGGSAKTIGASAHAQATGGTGTGGSAKTNEISAQTQVTGGTGTGGSAKTNGVSGQQEIWEIAPGEPYPVFLNWRAAGMAKQEGHWQENAYRFSYSELYNNRLRTTKILWPEFLQTVEQVTDSARQALAAGMKAVLPSWFVEKQAPTIESAQQVMDDLQAIIGQGAQVAMPQLAATASCQQTMSYAEATNQMAPQLAAAPTNENAAAYALFQPANLPAPSAPPEGFFQELAQKLAMRKQPQQQFQGVATDSFEKYKAWMADPVLCKEASAWAYKQDGVRIVFDEVGNPIDLERA